MSPDAFWDKGGYVCAQDVSSEYLAITVQCVMPVTGRFITIWQPNDYPPYGFEICDLRVYGQGEVTLYISICDHVCREVFTR